MPSMLNLRYLKLFKVGIRIETLIKFYFPNNIFVF